MAALLRRVLKDIDGRLLTSHRVPPSPSPLDDDFLDHGPEYLKPGWKNEAAVIAGIVFEDTIRRIYRTLDIEEKGARLAALTKKDILTALKAKRARAAAGSRTSAAHARWEGIQLSDVGPVIEFTRELMVVHLE